MFIMTPLNYTELNSYLVDRDIKINKQFIDLFKLEKSVNVYVQCGIDVMLLLEKNPNFKYTDKLGKGEMLLAGCKAYITIDFNIDSCTLCTSQNTLIKKYE